VAAAAARTLGFYLALVETPMFSRFLSEFHVPLFLAAGNQQQHGGSSSSSGGGASPATAAAAAAGRVRVCHVALFDAAVDSFNVMDQEKLEANAASGEDVRTVHPLPPVDPSFIATPAFDVCAERLIFRPRQAASFGGRRGGEAEGVGDGDGDDDDDDSDSHSDIIARDVVVHVGGSGGGVEVADLDAPGEAGALRQQQREFLGKVLAPGVAAMGTVGAGVQCTSIFSSSALAHEEGSSAALGGWWFGSGCFGVRTQLAWALALCACVVTMGSWFQNSE
jgi:hypothetical protein